MRQLPRPHHPGGGPIHWHRARHRDHHQNGDTVFGTATTATTVTTAQTTTVSTPVPPPARVPPRTYLFHYDPPCTLVIPLSFTLVSPTKGKRQKHPALLRAIPLCCTLRTPSLSTLLRDYRGLFLHRPPTAQRCPPTSPTAPPRASHSARARRTVPPRQRVHSTSPEYPPPPPPPAHTRGSCVVDPPSRSKNSPTRSHTHRSPASVRRAAASVHPSTRRRKL